MVFGPEKVELDLRFVRARVNQDDFVLVNRAASRLPDDAAKKLTFNLYSWLADTAVLPPSPSP